MFKKWFAKQEKPDDPIDLPHEAKIPGQDYDPELDIYSPTWRFIKARLEERLEKSREKNDSPRLGAEETATLRGKIAAYKELLDLPNEGRGMPLPKLVRPSEETAGY